MLDQLKKEKIDIRRFAGAKIAALGAGTAKELQLHGIFADLVPGMPDKLLYLDVDILFQHDIEMLYNINVTDYEYAAARDHYGKYLINPNYINAGVLLLNLAKIKETGLLVKARKLIQTKKLMFADQSAISRSTTKKKMLPKRLFYLPYPHTANVKQWNVSQIHRIFHYYVFDDILYDYIYLKKKYEQNEER